MPIIVATWETETRRIEVPGQPGQIVFKTLFLKQPKQNELEEWLK
jgi:hypothetical protein